MTEKRLDINAITLPQLKQMVREYLPDQDLACLDKAYEYACRVHADKKRISGHSYMSHLLAVAYTLAHMHLDLPTITAGLLHGTLKEHSAGSSSRDEIEKLFGLDVINIISGNTKITNVNFNSRMALQAENVRRMFLAMSADIRVLLVKLADRLHDMQTLSYLGKDRQLEVALETMDLYAPLASRLGIDWIKRELEDLSFSFLHPTEYRDLQSRIKTSLAERQSYVEKTKKLLTEKLTENGLLDFKVLGRPKHLYSIYKKLVAQKIPLEKVYDKVAFRIIVQTVGECYEVLGLVHSLWVPVSSRFKDFISTPKSNMYQSLHTSVIGSNGDFMEIQIRTDEMDRIAQEGIAAHWAYKEKKEISTRDARLFQWLKELIQGLKDLKDPQEFLDAVKVELQSAEVYVITPGGEVKALPQGSCPLDFAYAIHTEVGDHCVGAKVNDHIVPLRYELQNGDQVEIITSPNQKPGRAWLSLVKTSRARSRIRNWLNREEKERGLELGREICERELRKHGISLKKVVRTPQFQEIIKELGGNSQDELLRKVGLGKLTAKAIIDALLPEEDKSDKVTPPAGPSTSNRAEAPKSEARVGAISIDGIDGMLIKISQCCLPVPGDNIMGFITAGRGISIHKVNCPNFLATNPARHIEVDWSASDKTVHRSQIQIMAQDKKGLLASLGKAISSEDANIIHMEANTLENQVARISMDVEVTNLEHLTKLLQQLQQLDEVIEVKRR